MTNNITFPIIFENDPGFNIDPTYAVGIPEEGAEEYALIMKEKFVVVSLHESLHALYNTNYPAALFDPNNTGDPNDAIEHLNIRDLEKEFGSDLVVSDFFSTYLNDKNISYYDYIISNNLLTNSQADAVRDYRPF